MRILFIGGTGTISSAISKLLLKQGHELYLLNRGNKNDMFNDCDTDKLVYIKADINDEKSAKKALGNLSFDCVADFIAFEPEQVERDYRLFNGRTKQYIFISSASAYQKPLSSCVITESTPLKNTYWQYSENKRICEEKLMKRYRENGFPVTIVRPSHTYCENSIPIGVHGNKGSYQVIRRMLEGKPVLIPGDGSSLWTVTHNSDFAVGFAGLIGNIHALGEAVHITSDESLTWNQIYKIVADKLGVELKPYYVTSDFLSKCGEQFDYNGSLLGDKSNTVIFDNTKIKRLVPGFCAKKRFDQGAAETIEYILSHKECQIEDKEFDVWCDKVIEVLDKAVAEMRG